MGMFDRYKIKQSITTLLSSNNPTDQAVEDASARLHQIGRPAIPKLIEAFGKTRNPQPLARILAGFLNQETLPLFLATLTNASPRITAGVVEVLSHGEAYDPNRLLSLFANPKISREALETVLLSQKQRLQPEAILRLLTTAGSNDRELVFRLLEQVATRDIIPELIHRLRTEDSAMRLHIARTLSRFRTHAVRDTLVKLLTDPHKNVRMAALNGLADMQVTFDMGPLCILLRDPEITIRSKAAEVTLKKLEGGSEEVQKRIVQALNALGNSEIIKGLLQMLKEKEWAVISHVADILGKYGGATLIEIVLVLIKDPDHHIRTCALEILNSIQDEHSLKHLVDVLKDKEARERTAEALIAIGDRKIVPLFLRMLGSDPEASRIAIRMLVALGGSQAIHPLLVHLQNPDISIRRDVLRALAVLTDEECAPDVLRAIMALRDNAENGLKALANKMATNIVKRFGQKVVPPRDSGETSLTQTQVEKSDTETTPAHTPRDSEVTVVSHPAEAVAIAVETTLETADIAALEPGIVLANRYRIIQRAGEGGFSSVFLVDDTMVHEDVILKILNPQGTLDGNTIKRFIHELRYARMVTHENVIRIHDFLTLGKSYAISMEYFPSHNLADEIQKGAPLSLKRGLKIIWDVCRGVGAAHQVNVVHRDLKPPNILINDKGLVKIVDFGVAAVASDASTRLTKIGTLLGTPSYMAPEQVRCRDVDARTDIYSLGIIMYEVFTGQKPYTGDVMTVLFKHVEGKPLRPREINPDIPPELESIILQAMAVEPEARFQSIEALRKRLMTFSRQKS